MARKTWTVDVDGTAHAVALEWTYWGGKRHVEVDGEVVDDDNFLMRWKSDQRFEIDGHNVTVRTQPSKNPTMFAIELELDGVVVPPDPGQKAFWELEAKETPA